MADTNNSAFSLPPAYTEMPQMPVGVSVDNVDIFNGGLEPIYTQPVANTLPQMPVAVASNVTTLKNPADYFASYFPTTITGGKTNPMVGADVVQGPNPQALGLDPIIAAIQSQYTPQTFTQSGGSYGAQRFIDSPISPIGSSPAVGGNVATPWFKQGEFNLADYQNNLPTEVADQVASGNLYGGSDYSPVTSAETQAWLDDPYSSLFNPLPKFVKAGANMLIPGAGALIGAASGYQNAVGANAMQTALSAYGGEPNTTADPFVSALMGAFGRSPEGVENAQALASNFESPENLYGYMAAAQDPAISDIVSNYYASLAENGQTYQSPTANDVGALGYIIGEQINRQVSQKVSLNDAVQNVAENYGSSPSESAAIAANLNTQDPLGQLIGNLNLVNEGAQAVYDPTAGQWSPAASDASFLKATGATLAPVTPVQTPVTTPTSDSSSAPTEAPTGGYVTDSRGNIVTSGDGTAVTWGTGAPSYTPTENEQSFARTDGYTADVPSASQGGYDPTSGYDSDTDSGGSSGGGGKIVCTAMNEAYGFGSFRNRIWLKYSAEHMTKAHEAGYHTLFLPLVDLAYKKNVKPLRVVLENIARHRSADLRAEMRGSKRDKLGRAYRFVLEPLCYIVGKLKGY